MPHSTSNVAREAAWNRTQELSSYRIAAADRSAGIYRFEPLTVSEVRDRGAFRVLEPLTEPSGNVVQYAMRIVVPELNQQTGRCVKGVYEVYAKPDPTGDWHNPTWEVMCPVNRRHQANVILAAVQQRIAENAAQRMAA